MAYCKKCGEELNPGAKFCPNCGEATSMSNESIQEQEGKKKRLGPQVKLKLKT